MNLVDAEALLAELSSRASGTSAEVGTAGRTPHDYAYLKLTSRSDPADFAVVSTPGDRWFELEVAGGFVTGQTSDLTDDQAVREYLEGYLQAAIAYLAGKRSVGKSRLFRVPYVTVHSDDGPLRLNLTVPASIEQMLKR